MSFSEIGLKKIVDKGFNNVSLEKGITFNILNFIHCIYLNHQDLCNSFFDSQIFGDVEMTFGKDEGSLIEYYGIVIKRENWVIDYLFTENAFELLQDVAKE